ncbi:MAG: aminotransferase class I/II-fold pyridoxal phosphate-dependent enzyme, partial [Actinomycetia bacterium]|nr:aminotransferase class I/II-fold pyridoxal phosphate-dependent enzyme [Actinomycetes bacterium]
STCANLQSLMTFIEPGDHVVSFLPGYQQLYDLPRALGAEVTVLRLREDQGWRVDLDELAAALRPDTKMIALANANNPTGSLMERPEMEALAELARQRGAYLHVDEVFESFDTSRDVVRIADLYERGISTGSVSKAYSMPGIRVGWTATSKELADEMRHYRDYLFLCAGGIDDALAVHTLRNRDAIFARNRALLRRNLDIVRNWVATQSRVSMVVPPDVSVAFPRIDIPQPVEEFCVDILRDCGVLLIPGSRFGIEGYARLGYCCHTEVLEKGLAALGEYLGKFDEC